MIRFLLRLYPAAWRKEYGEEFADVLASHPLTLCTTANVVWSAACQRLWHMPAWLPAGLVLFLFYLKFVHDDWPCPFLAIPSSSMVVGLLATGVWGAARKNGSFATGLNGTIKAMLVGFAPLAVCYFMWNLTGFTVTTGDRSFSGPLRLSDIPQIVFGVLRHLDFGVKYEVDWGPSPSPLLLRLEFVAVQLFFFVAIAMPFGCGGAICGSAIRRLRRQFA
jgi:hypothetical protein